jgi:hypothetical protein
VWVHVNMCMYAHACVCMGKVGSRGGLGCDGIGLTRQGRAPRVHVRLGPWNGQFQAHACSGPPVIPAARRCLNAPPPDAQGAERKGKGAQPKKQPKLLKQASLAKWVPRRRFGQHKPNTTAILMLELKSTDQTHAPTEPSANVPHVHPWLPRTLRSPPG